MKSKPELDEARIADALMDDATRTVPVSVDILPRVRARLAQPRTLGVAWRNLAPLGALAALLVLMGGALITNPRLRFMAQQAFRAFANAPTAPALETAATALPASAANTPNGVGDLISYTVQSGDTFYSLSKKFNAYPDMLAYLNGMDAADSLTAGQMITVRNNPPSPTAVPPLVPIFSSPMRPILQPATEPNELLRLRVNKGTADVVAWSPDGTAFAVASPSYVTVYDAATLHELGSQLISQSLSKLVLRENPVFKSIAGKDKGWLVSGQFLNSPDPNVASQNLGWYAWDSFQGMVIGQTALEDVKAYSDDGDFFVAVKNQSSVEVRQRTTQQVLLQAHVPECSHPASVFRFSADKRFMACLMPQGAVLFNLQTQTHTNLFWAGREQTPSQTFKGGDLAFSADGRRLGAGNEEFISVWDIETEVTLLNLKVHAPPRRIRMSRDGTRMGVYIAAQITPNNEQIDAAGLNIFDVARGELAKSLDEEMRDFDLSPDGKRVVIAQQGDLKLMQIASRELIGQMTDYSTYAPVQLVFGLQGQRILFGDHVGSLALDVAARRVIENKLAGPFFALAISPDGKRAFGLVIAPPPSPYVYEILSVVLVDIETGNILKQFYAETKQLFGIGTKAVFRPDGRAIIFHRTDDVQRGLAQLDLETGQIKRLIAEFWREEGFAISKDGNIVAGVVGNVNVGPTYLEWRKTIQIRSVAEPHVVLTRTISVKNEKYDYVQLMFSTDAKVLLMANATLGVQVWDVKTGQTVKTLPVAETDSLYSATLCPDGKRVAIINSSNHIVIWDVATAKPIRTLAGHSGDGWLFALVFSPDGKTLATQGSDGTLRVWQVE